MGAPAEFARRPDRYGHAGERARFFAPRYRADVKSKSFRDSHLATVRRLGGSETDSFWAVRGGTQPWRLRKTARAESSTRTGRTTPIRGPRKSRWRCSANASTISPNISRSTQRTITHDAAC